MKTKPIARTIIIKRTEKIIHKKTTAQKIITSYYVKNENKILTKMKKLIITHVLGWISDALPLLLIIFKVTRII